jgi:hypothetical protein
MNSTNIFVFVNLKYPILFRKYPAKAWSGIIEKS